MLPNKKFQEISAQNIIQLLKDNYASLMPSFYETQSSFLSSVYKRYGSVETATILLCFTRAMHLEIIRQREKDLNHNVSLENFWNNFNRIPKPIEKVTSIVNSTGVPKETVRRKISSLIKSGFLLKKDDVRGYVWNFHEKEKEGYIQHINMQIKTLSKFVSRFSTLLNLPFSSEVIEKEIKLQFSFYWYHFLSCQLQWYKMWQQKLKDNDLLLISLQVTIPTLQFADKKKSKVKLEEVFKIIGRLEGDVKDNISGCAVSATTISELTGIPRATCIRKLEKLVNLGFLSRENKSKRYYVNQATDSRTKNIMHKDNVNFTIELYSKYFSIILNSLSHNYNRS